MRRPAPGWYTFGSPVSPADLLRTAMVGLLAHRLRVLLSGLGIAIGIGAVVAVGSISASSGAELDTALGRLGTNMLTVTAGQTLFGEAAQLPTTAPGMVSRIGTVTAVSATGQVPGVRVYRNDRIAVNRSGAIRVLATRLDLTDLVGGQVRSGTWLNEGTAGYPAVVLGADAAETLGIADASPGPQIWLGERWFTVVGVLAPLLLAPDIDNAALIGWPVAERLLHFDGHPTTVYERSADHSVDAVRDVLPRTASPEHPEQVLVSRPSDLLEARAAARQAFAGLLIGIGAVALLVGGIGVANTMVIAVLERRAEIGLRRALGAARADILAQFLAESLLVSTFGGVLGALLGCLVSAGYAVARGWPVTIPAYLPAAAVVVAITIGVLAGAYPAVRAARLPPTEALASA